MKILLSVTLASFLLIGCSEQSAKKVDETAEAVKETTVQGVAEVKKVAEKTVEVTEETSEELVESSEELAKQTQEVVDKTVEVSKEIATKTVEVSKEIATQAKTLTTQAVAAAKETINEVAKDVQKATEDKGATIYKACAGCHGATGEKPALGKSQVIKGWSVSQTEHALNGYKDGSYGATMKAVMKGQATKLSAEDIKAVAEYISKF